MDTENISNRWAEYINDLYGGDRPERPPDAHLEGTPILEEEVIDAMAHMKQGKASGPDNIAVEEFSALGEFGIKIISQNF